MNYSNKNRKNHHLHNTRCCHCDGALLINELAAQHCFRCYLFIPGALRTKLRAARGARVQVRDALPRALRAVLEGFEL
jgi:hypothetical protein